MGQVGRQVRIRIVADDLTGAADAAAAFASRGVSASVVLSGRAPRPDATVLSLSTDSRRRSPEAAIRAVMRASEYLGDVQGISFKKIDSLLRGNIAVEVATALREWALPRAVVAPAFPATGRTTTGGIQFVDGIPVHLADHGDGGAVVADLRQVMAGLPCTVCDAAVDADLDGVVARHWGEDVLWVGSAGLAAAIARRLTGTAMPTASQAPEVRSVLVVVGSRHPITVRQVAALGVSVAPRTPSRVCEVLIERGVAVVCSDGEDDWSRVTDVAAQVPVDAMVLIGGDTALAVLTRLGVQSLTVLAEPWPGSVLARASGNGRWLLLRSGAFGAEDALHRVLAWWKGERL